MSTPRGSILLVDDEPIALRGHSRLLSRLGFRTEATDHVEHAVGVVAAGGVDVVLADVHMPECSGPELARELRVIDPGVQIVYLSGAPSIEIVSLSAAEGSAFLAKPVAVPALLAALDDAVARRRRYDGLQLAGSLASRFDRAVRDLDFHYQPIVRSTSGELTGWEALMRPRSGLGGALEVLEAARRLDRMQAVGRAVRRRALVPWNGGAREGETLFCNVHPAELLDDDLFDPDAPLSRMAQATVLEITEMRSLDGIPDVAGRVGRLRDLGFTIAIDDLGAGHAGLGTLVALEPQIAKLDSAMMRGIDESPRRRQVVGGIVRLCHDLGIEVIAEGIETDGQRRCAEDLGCDRLQGFAIGRPAELGTFAGRERRLR